MRDAVGDDVDILIELHSAPSATSAIQIGHALEEFNCMFFEEGVHYLNVALQEKVTQSIRIPMAAGERLYTRWGYRQYFEKQALAMIQPDLCLVGGITEGKKVCDYAHVYDITVQMHVCGSPISTAAALQLEAVIPNFQIHEHHVNAIKQGNREVCVQDYQPHSGRYAHPGPARTGTRTERNRHLPVALCRRQVNVGKLLLRTSGDGDAGWLGLTQYPAGPPLGDGKNMANVTRDLALPRRAQKFPRAASFRMALSREISATSFITG